MMSRLAVTALLITVVAIAFGSIGFAYTASTENTGNTLTAEYVVLEQSSYTFNPDAILHLDTITDSEDTVYRITDPSSGSTTDLVKLIGLSGGLSDPVYYGLLIGSDTLTATLVGLDTDIIHVSVNTSGGTFTDYTSSNWRYIMKVSTDGLYNGGSIPDQYAVYDGSDTAGETTYPMWTVIKKAYDAENGEWDDEYTYDADKLDIVRDVTYTTSLYLACYGLLINDGSSVKSPGRTIEVSGDITVKAVWTTMDPDDRTISFANGSRSAGVMAPVVVHDGASYTLPDCKLTPPDGKKFKCWSVSGIDRSPGDMIRNITDDITVTAVWQDVGTDKKISFAAGTGASGTMAPVFQASQSNYVLPEPQFVAPENKMFAYWQVSDAHKNPGDEIHITNDIEITAVWTDKDSTKWKITYESGPGTGSMPDNFMLSSTGRYQLLENNFEAPAGMKFKCWSVYAPISKKAGASVTITNDITLTAVWTVKAGNDRTVTFEHGTGADGYMAPAVVADGGDYTLPACQFTPPDGKKFKCWSVSSTEYAPGATIENIGADVTVTAVWQDVGTDKKISFAAGTGASGTMAPAFGATSSTYTLPACQFIAPEGMMFSCWLVGSDEMDPGDSLTIGDDDIVATAVWTEKDGTEWKVTYDHGIGTGSMPDNFVSAGSGTYQLLDSYFTAPAGMKFDHWSVSPTGNIVIQSTYSPLNGVDEDIISNGTIKFIYKSEEENQNEEEPEEPGE